MEHRKVAIVITNYNGCEDTIKCLESLCKSSYKDFFVVVCDDCSSCEKCKNLGNNLELSLDIEYISTPTNLGFAGANNMAIKKAMLREPEYILLLNNDTVVYEDSLQKLVDSADKESLCGPKLLLEDEKSIYSAGGRFNSKLHIPENIGMGHIDDGSYDKEDSLEYLSFASCLIPVEVFEKIGFLDESYYMYSEDVDFCQRAKAKGYKIKYIPQSVIIHKAGGSGFSSNKKSTFLGIRNECYIREKYIPDGINYNKKLYEKVKREYLFRKVIHKPHEDNTLYYEAMTAYYNRETGNKWNGE